MLEKIRNQMHEMIKSLNDKYILTLYESLPHGKMLRSKLILNITKTDEKSLSLCAIVELIQLASLLHDDVIDDANMRRGERSFNAKFGDKNAIMLGDILYSKAFFELTKLPLDVARVVSDSVSKLSIGEMLDVKLANGFNSDKNLYLDMIYKKTSSLIEASAISAALLAKKDEKKFSIYGKNLGLAFQIIDDVLDITQDSVKLGKPALNDFKEGKTTLPYIYMYEKLNEPDKQKLLKLFKKDLSKNEQIWIKEKLNQTGAVLKSINDAKEYGKIALNAIENENNLKLNETVSSMIDRKF